MHWAAAVNNEDAARTLLQNGANRDAQDNKDETPLFVAAKEGKKSNRTAFAFRISFDFVVEVRNLRCIVINLK